MQPQHDSRHRYRTAAAAFGGAILIAGGALVHLSGVGIDILAVALLVLLLLVLDRTVGDWLAETSTSGVPNLLFAGLLAVGVCGLFLSSTGAAWMEKFLQIGETRGYQGLWIKSHSSYSAAAEPAASRDSGTGTAPAARVRTSGAPRLAGGASSSRRLYGRDLPRPGIQPGAVSPGSPDSPTRAAVAESGVAASGGPTATASTSGSRVAVTHAGAAEASSSLPNTSAATAIVVRVTPRSARPGEDVAAVAMVTAGRGGVRKGRVEFSVNGVVHSSASVGADSSARVLLKGLRPGVFSIQARFTGSTDLLPSSSSSVQVTITPNE
jgi:hypothetical protein